METSIEIGGVVMDAEKKRPRTSRKNPTPRKRPHDYDSAIVDSSPEEATTWDGHMKHSFTSTMLKESGQSKTSSKMKDTPSATTSSPELCRRSPRGKSLPQSPSHETRKVNELNTEYEKSPKELTHKKRKLAKVKKSIAKMEERIARLKQSLTHKDDGKKAPKNITKSQPVKPVVDVEKEAVSKDDLDDDLSANLKDDLKCGSAPEDGCTTGEVHAGFTVSDVTKHIVGIETPPGSIDTSPLPNEILATAVSNRMTPEQHIDKDLMSVDGGGTRENQGQHVARDSVDNWFVVVVNEAKSNDASDESNFVLVPAPNVHCSMGEIDCKTMDLSNKVNCTDDTDCVAIDLSTHSNSTTASDCGSIEKLVATTDSIQEISVFTNNSRVVDQTRIEDSSKESQLEAVDVSKPGPNTTNSASIPMDKDEAIPNVHKQAKTTEVSSTLSDRKYPRKQHKDVLASVIEDVCVSLISSFKGKGVTKGVDSLMETDTTVRSQDDEVKQVIRRPKRKLLKMCKRGSVPDLVPPQDIPVDDKLQQQSVAGSWKSPGTLLHTPKPPPSVCTARIMRQSVEKVKRRVRFSPDKAIRSVKKSLVNVISMPPDLAWVDGDVFPAGNGDVSWVDEDILPLPEEDEDADGVLSHVTTTLPSCSLNQAGLEVASNEKEPRKSKRLAIKRNVKEKALGGTKSKVKAKPKAQPKLKGKPTAKRMKSAENIVVCEVSEGTPVPVCYAEAIGSGPAEDVHHGLNRQKDKSSGHVISKSSETPDISTKRGAKRKSQMKGGPSNEMRPKQKRRKCEAKISVDVAHVTCIEIESTAAPLTIDTENLLAVTPVKDDGSLSSVHSELESPSKHMTELTEILMSLKDNCESSPNSSTCTSPSIITTTTAAPKMVASVRKVPIGNRTPSKTPRKVNFRSRTPSKVSPRLSVVRGKTGLPSPARFLGMFSAQVRQSELSFQEMDTTSSASPKVGRVTCSAIEVLDTQAPGGGERTTPAVEKDHPQIVVVTPPRRQRRQARRPVLVSSLSRPSCAKKKLRPKLGRGRIGWQCATVARDAPVMIEDSTDSAGGDQLRIVGDDDDAWEDESLDEQLDEKASAASIRLTATNIKTIIKEVITNEQVLDMVRNTLLEEGLEDQLKEAIFEPRLTRAKIKKALENGNIPQTMWPLTPVKGNPTSPKAKTLTDIEFPEDEDDEDYDPLKDESDVDSESVVSSRASDFGSPHSQLTATPTPCEPPTKPAVVTRQRLLEEKMRDEPPLALRLRSKMSLTETALETIEASFVAPDITPDLYDEVQMSTPNEKDWQSFLWGLTTTTPQLEMNDTYDEKNDPEYNILEDADEIDDWDYRHDRATKVSKKEIASLMEELFDAYHETIDEDTCEEPPADMLLASGRGQGASTSRVGSPAKLSYKPKVPPMTLDTPASILVVGGVKDFLKENDQLLGTSDTDQPCQDPIPILSSNELIQVQDQMRKHVQLLAQTFVLSKSAPEYQHFGQQAAGLLGELNMLGAAHTQSYFRALNLQEALVLVANGLFSLPNEVGQVYVYKHMRNKWKRSLGLPDQIALSWSQMANFCSSRIFLFPQMLPELRFYERTKPASFSIFSSAEDNLLALGVEQFNKKVGSRQVMHSLIQEYILPTKTVAQLQLRYKRLNSGECGHNILKELRDNKVLPLFERYLQLESEENICSPQERNPELMPSWYKYFDAVKRDIMNGKISLELDIDVTRSATPDSLDGSMTDTSEPENPIRAQLSIPQPAVSPSTRGRSNIPIASAAQGAASVAAEHDRGEELPAPDPPPQVLPVIGTTGIAQYVILANPITTVMTPTNANATPSDPVIIMSSAELECYGAQMINTVTAVATAGSTTTVTQAVCASHTSSVTKEASWPCVDFLREAVESCGVNEITAQDSVESVCVPAEVEQLHISMPPEDNLPDTSVQPGISVQSRNDFSSITVPVEDNRMGISEHSQDDASSVSVQPQSSQLSISIKSSDEPTGISVQSETDRLGVQSKDDMQTEFAHTQEYSITSAAQTMASPSHLILMPSTTSCSANVLTSQEKVLTSQILQTEESTGTPSEVAESSPAGVMQQELPVLPSTPIAVQDHQPEVPKSPAVTLSPVVNIGEADKLDASTSDVDVTTVSPVHQVPTDIEEPVFCAELVADGENSKMTPLKSNAMHSDSPSKILSPANLLLTGGSKIGEGNDLDLQLEADHPSFNDSTDKSFEDLDTSMHVMNTPQKFIPNEETSCSPTVYSDRSYSNSPGYSDTTQSPKNLNTPTKSAVEIMAAFAEYMTTPPRRTPKKHLGLAAAFTASTPSPRKHLTPSKLFLSPSSSRPFPTTPIRFRSIVPKPGPQSPTPVISPILKKKNNSPRRKILQQKARAILPKGFVASTFSVSPTKKVASCLTRRARTRSGFRKILPKTEVRKLDLNGSEEPIPTADDENEDTDLDVIETDFASGYDTLDSEYASEENQSADDKENNSTVTAQKPESEKPKTVKQKRLRKKKEKKLVEDGESGSEDDGFGFGLRLGAESQDEGDDEDPFAQFMAASTTIRFDPKSRPSAIDCQKTKSKATAKREMTLHMLAPDLVGSDVLRDERDTAFAQAYLTRVKDTLRDDKDTLESFIKLLHDFGRSQKTPVQLHTAVQELLAAYPDLSTDFSGFLLPDQAQQCGCFVTNLEFARARSFLRKLETFFSKHPSHLQKILKVFTSWNKTGSDVCRGDASDLRDQVTPLLKGHPHLVDEFSSLFSSGKPSTECHADDFEEVNLVNEDDDSSEPPALEAEQEDEQEVEEVRLPEAPEDEQYGTARCRCHCHSRPEKMYARRKHHCHSCSMKIIQGKLFMQTMEKTLRPVSVHFVGPTPAYKPVHVPAPAPPDEDEPLKDDLSSDDDPFSEPPQNTGQKAIRKSQLKVKIPKITKSSSARHEVVLPGKSQPGSEVTSAFPTVQTSKGSGQSTAYSEPLATPPPSQQPQPPAIEKVLPLTETIGTPPTTKAQRAPTHNIGNLGSLPITTRNQGAIPDKTENQCRPPATTKNLKASTTQILRPPILSTNPLVTGNLGASMSTSENREVPPHTPQSPVVAEPTAENQETPLPIDKSYRLLPLALPHITKKQATLYHSVENPLVSSISAEDKQVTLSSTDFSQLHANILPSQMNDERGTVKITSSTLRDNEQITTENVSSAQELVVASRRTSTFNLIVETTQTSTAHQSLSSPHMRVASKGIRIAKVLSDSDSSNSNSHSSNSNSDSRNSNSNSRSHSNDTLPDANSNSINVNEAEGSSFPIVSQEFKLEKLQFPIVDDESSSISVGDEQSFSPSLLFQKSGQNPSHSTEVPVMDGEVSTFPGPNSLFQKSVRCLNKAVGENCQEVTVSEQKSHFASRSSLFQKSMHSPNHTPNADSQAEITMNQEESKSPSPPSAFLKSVRISSHTTADESQTGIMDEEESQFRSPGSLFQKSLQIPDNSCSGDVHDAVTDAVSQFQSQSSLFQKPLQNQNQKTDEKSQASSNAIMNSDSNKDQAFLHDDATMGFNITSTEEAEQQNYGKHQAIESGVFNEFRGTASLVKTKSLQEAEVTMRSPEKSSKQACDVEVVDVNEDQQLTPCLKQSEACSELIGKLKEATAGPSHEKQDWTRYDDKEILLTYKRLGDTPHAFQLLAEKLPSHPTMHQVEARFRLLMKLFESEAESSEEEEEEELESSVVVDT